MKLFAVSLCCFVLITCPITFGQNFFPSCERRDPLMPQMEVCDVTGTWTNELKSCMNISVVGNEVRGMYWTAVESNPGAAGPTKLGDVIGWLDSAPHPTIAFTVLWAKGSCTAWVGQCFTPPEGGQILKTLWILRSVADSLEDNWKSTSLGADDFIYHGKGGCVLE